MKLRSLSYLALTVLCLSHPVAAEEPEAHARRLINALGCKGCHSFEQSGSTLAPPLDRIGRHLDLQQLHERLAGHQTTPTGAYMPSYATLPPEDMATILQFLADRK